MATMGLASVAIPTHSIKVPDGGQFAVRGLSLVDITGIYQEHGGELAIWFEKFVSGADDAGSSMVDAVSSIIASAPHLAAKAIAVAADDTTDEGAAIVSRLPLGVQFEALSAIGELTFTEDMPPKKVLQIVVKMATGVVGPATTPSPTDGAA